MDPYVEALRRLCEREGGYKVVADAIDAHDQSLYQIVAGVLLPSGNPKGVGPALRKKLTEHYPDWLRSASPHEVAEPAPSYRTRRQPAPTTTRQALQLIIKLLEQLDPFDLHQARAAIKQAIDQPEYLDKAADLIDQLSRPRRKLA